MRPQTNNTTLTRAKHNTWFQTTLQFHFCSRPEAFTKAWAKRNGEVQRFPGSEVAEASHNPWTFAIPPLPLCRSQVLLHQEKMLEILFLFETTFDTVHLFYHDTCLFTNVRCPLIFPHVSLPRTSLSPSCILRVSLPHLALPPSCVLRRRWEQKAEL